MTSFLQIYSNDNAASLLFELDPTEINFEDKRTLESLDIPGLVWNQYFDSLISNGRIRVRGIFIASDNDWVGYQAAAPRFYGRPFDFIHQLRSTLRTVDATTGNSFSASDPKVSFILNLVNKIGSTEHSYTLSTAYNSNSIYFTCESVNCKYFGGEVMKVEYDISFVETAGIIRLG